MLTSKLANKLHYCSLTLKDKDVFLQDCSTSIDHHCHVESVNFNCFDENVS